MTIDKRVSSIQCASFTVSKGKQIPLNGMFFDGHLPKIVNFLGFGQKTAGEEFNLFETLKTGIITVICLIYLLKLGQAQLKIMKICILPYGTNECVVHLS